MSHINRAMNGCIQIEIEPGEPSFYRFGECSFYKHLEIRWNKSQNTVGSPFRVSRRPPPLLVIAQCLILALLLLLLLSY